MCSTKSVLVSPSLPYFCNHASIGFSAYFQINVWIICWKAQNNTYKESSLCWIPLFKKCGEIKEMHIIGWSSIYFSVMIMTSWPRYCFLFWLCKNANLWIANYSWVGGTWHIRQLAKIMEKLHPNQVKNRPAY